MFENTSTRTMILAGAAAVSILMTVGSVIKDHYDAKAYVDIDEPALDAPVDPTLSEG